MLEGPKTTFVLLTASFKLKLSEGFLGSCPANFPQYLTRAILERLGYHVLEAKTGKEAVSIARTFDGDIGLVILDIVLPDIRGKDIYSLLMEARPNLKVIVCSGYSIDGPAQEILDAGDPRQLEGLVLLAVNQAIRDSQLMAARRLSPFSGDLDP